MPNIIRPLIYCALDTKDIDHALTLCRIMEKTGCGIKLGMEFFNALGPQGIDRVRQKYPDLSLFIDLKYHDIPNTVAGAVRSIAPLKPDYLNVHALGGETMMRAAQDAVTEFHDTKTRLLAVTILTSMDDAQLCGIGITQTPKMMVRTLARLTQNCGLSGIVCSAEEISLMRKAHGKDFTLMVPGIRPAGSAASDQKRIMTPANAIKEGASHLVIGRPITQADDPEKAISDILSEISG